MNNVQLIGRLTRDPELRSTSGGKSVGNLRLAIDRRDRDADPIYIDVVCWNGLAETCAQYLAKGRQIAVTGRLYYPRVGHRRRRPPLQARDRRHRRRVPQPPKDDEDKS